jgi:hypothetical protein
MDNMKNCTKHFLERWTERIVGITTEKERNEYISLNRDMIVEHANKTFEYSQFVYKGQIGDNITRNYYIKDDIVFVTNTTDDALITIYKVDLGFTEELNVTVRKGLIDEIAKLREEQNAVEFEILIEVDNKEFEISSVDENIKILEEQLHNLKKQKHSAEQEVKSIKSKALNTGLELKKYTLMLVNSKEYKKDLTTMK